MLFFNILENNAIDVYGKKISNTTLLWFSFLFLFWTLLHVIDLNDWFLKNVVDCYAVLYNKKYVCKSSTVQSYLLPRLSNLNIIYQQKNPGSTPHTVWSNNQTATPSFWQEQ